MRTYFISYRFQTKQGEEGYGRGSVERDQPIRGLADIASAEALLRDKNKFKAVCIQNWQPFESPDPAPLDAIVFAHGKNELDQPCLFISRNGNNLLKKEMGFVWASQVAAAFGKELIHS